jgi:membrane protein implicated in regulation of membrane protease activity
MKLLQHQITEPKTDVWIYVGVGIFGALFSLLLLPYRSGLGLLFLSAVNVLNGWRVHRKLKSTPQS